MSFSLETLLSRHLMNSKRRFISFDDGTGDVLLLCYFSLLSLSSRALLLGQKR